jgi:hypothetical protein
MSRRARTTSEHRDNTTPKADLVTMRDNTISGYQVIVKGKGLTMAGTERGALVEVIVVLEAGFRALCLHFNDSAGLRLRLSSWRTSEASIQENENRNAPSELHKKASTKFLDIQLASIVRSGREPLVRILAHEHRGTGGKFTSFFGVVS